MNLFVEKRGRNPWEIEGKIHKETELWELQEFFR